MNKLTVIAVLISLPYLTNQPLCAADITDCDRLAAHNSDPDKAVSEGVSGRDISAGAITACRAAVAAEPDNMRFRYQLARALAETGRAAEGHADMQMAATGGYRQAQFVLGYLYDEGMQGLTKDPCAAATLWRSAANQGLMAALISFPHHVLGGQFDTCELTVAHDTLLSMLQQAQAIGPDYYQRMIISDLLAELAAVEKRDVERSALFSMTEGDVLEDSGLIVVSSKSSTRTESFETVRHSSGGRTITSVITDLEKPYRVEGRWSYDALGRSTEARGLGAYDGIPARVTIAVQRPSAIIQVNAGPESRSVSASCSSACFVDLSPSVMAMFSVTRQFEANSTRTQSFQWIGQALHVDRTLLDGGGSDVRLHSIHRLGSLEVLQFLFLETLPGDRNSKATNATFNLYVDADHRPLAFATQSGTTGVRSGYENITQLFPPVFTDK